MGLAELIAASCLGAASVSYRPTPLGLPWIRSGKVTANLAYYLGPTSMDGRVNQVEVATIHVGRPSRIVWTVRGRRPSALVVRAEQLGGSGRVIRRVGASSTLALPAEGCWRLTVRSGKDKGGVRRPCGGATRRAVLRTVSGVPVGPAPEARQRHLAAGDAATLADRVGALRQHSGRRRPGRDLRGRQSPEGWSTKFLWWSPRSRGDLELVGRRLDGTGSFRQWLHSASSTDPPVTGDVYPSIVNIPTAGCWGLTLRSPRVAGFVVFQAVVTS